MKRKFKSAEAKRLAEENRREWEAMLKRHSTPEVKRPSGVRPYEPAKSLIRQTERPGSRVTAGGSTNWKREQHYTGDQMLGIGQMHKSNATPIFNSDAAVDLAHMRR